MCIHSNVSRIPVLIDIFVSMPPSIPQNLYTVRELARAHSIVLFVISFRRDHDTHGAAIKGIRTSRYSLGECRVVRKIAGIVYSLYNV